MDYQYKNFYFKAKWKEFFFFLFLWLLLYIEPLTIGPLKISQLWKAIVVISILVYILLIRKKIPLFVWIGIFFAFKYLFYIHMPYGYFTAIQNTLESLIFPLILCVFYIRYKNKPDASERLMHIAIILSLFFIFSAIPFFFGLNTLNPTTELEKYGIEADAMKGLFYHIAVSSKLFTIATIVIFNSYRRFSNTIINKLTWITAIFFGTYFIYTSWTRTGWLIFLIGILISFYYNSGLKAKAIAITVSILLFFGIVFLYENNQAFKYRLTGGTTYRTNTELSIEQLASARLPFIIVAIDNLKDQGIPGQIFGYGTQKGIDLFKQKTGMAIVSHNRTFEILESSGIIGLLLYFIFILQIFNKLRSKWDYASKETKKLAFISILMFLGFYLTSHGTPFWGEIIFSCFFISVIIEKSNK